MTKSAARQSKQEIIRRYFATACNVKKGLAEPSELHKQEMLMNYLHLTPDMRPLRPAARKKAEETGAPAAAIELPDGRIVTGKTSGPDGRVLAALLNSLKTLAGIHDRVNLYRADGPRADPASEGGASWKLQPASAHRRGAHRALDVRRHEPHRRNGDGGSVQPARRRGPFSVILSSVDENTFKKLGMHVTLRAGLTSPTL